MMNGVMCHVKDTEKANRAFCRLGSSFFLLGTSLPNPKLIYKRNIAIYLSEKLYHYYSNTNMAVANIHDF